MVAYDYAYIRALPHPHLPCGETVAAVLHARRIGLLAIATADAGAVAARWTGIDAGLLERYLDALVALARGGDTPIGRLPPSERFHFLTAVRSTVLQPGDVRTGLDDDPAAAFVRIAAACGLAVR